MFCFGRDSNQPRRAKTAGLLSRLTKLKFSFFLYPDVVVSFPEMPKPLLLYFFTPSSTLSKIQTDSGSARENPHESVIGRQPRGVDSTWDGFSPNAQISDLSGVIYLILFLIFFLGFEEETRDTPIAII